ncbi:hypothetical protein C0995_011029 [Termitomyces sp. Mi166|nr:hypothetical protein C0995_011029 [Termitomyces sp. Mi166\
MPGNGLVSSCLESKICTTTVVDTQSHSPQTPPLVTVDSPESVRSPRSPRLTGLLHALKDVIGEDPDDAYDYGEEATFVEDSVKAMKIVDTSEGNTVIEIGHSLSNVEDEGRTENTGTEHVFNHEDKVLRLPSLPHGLSQSETEPQPSMQTTGYSIISDPPSSTLLSPIHITPLHLALSIPDSRESEVQEDSYGGSDSTDTSKPNLRSSLSTLKSTFGVLSSPFATPSLRVLSPHLSSFITRPLQSPFAPSSSVEDDDVPSDISLDSPADQSFVHDEPEPVPSEQYVLVGPETGVMDEVAGGPVSKQETETKGEPETEVHQPTFEDEEAEHHSKPSWDYNGDATIICEGMPPVTPDEVHGALRQSAQTPVHFLADEVDFDDDEPIANSSFTDSGDATSGESQTSESFDFPAVPVESQCKLDSSSTPSPPFGDCEDSDIEPDKTTQLAYLCSPTLPLNEGDILHSLYDQYYDLPMKEEPQSKEISIEMDAKNPLVKDNESPVVESPLLVTPLDDPLLDTAEIESSLSVRPMRSDLLRERVFIPPPPTRSVTRGRSGTIIAVDSSRSGPTPTAPFSLPQQACPSSGSACSPDRTVLTVQEVAASKKVPFGFRKSMSRTDATTFTAASHRVSMTIRPPPASTANVARTQPPKNTSPTSAPANGLRPLRLSSTILASSQPSSAPTHKSVFSADSYRPSRNSHRISLSSASVSSNYSYSRNPLLLSSTSVIPEYVRNTQFTTDDIPSPLSSIHLRRLATFESAFDDSPRSAPLSRPVSWQSNSAVNDLNESTQNEYMLTRPLSQSQASSEIARIYEDDETDEDDVVQEDERDHLIRPPLPMVPHSAPPIVDRRSSIVGHRASIVDRRASVARLPVSVPKPTLMFAIASDDVKQVRRVLEAGDAGPNDSVGPQSALTFALTNEQLTNKIEIVKTLLAYGADPKAIVQSAPASGPLSNSLSLNERQNSHDEATSPRPSLMDTLDPATRYYVGMADAPHTRKTSVLIQRSFFRPLMRVRYELIGQDQALEQLFKDLSIHSRQLSVTPIVILLCGPSGHGKSLLARKFGSLLDVPTHTVGMTTVHSAQDLWKSYSISPDEPPSTRTLAEFLCDNEGKRCVVVLDEIEKTHGESPLWALLMPWEHGRCTFEANGRLVDTRNVVWLGTSNIGQDLVFEHHYARALPNELMSKGEYTELMGLLRPRVSERLGASMLSRVTTVLPFAPFTPEERKAICYEALYTIAGDIVQTLPTDVVDAMVKGALANYTPAEGARSIYRAVSNQLVDNI